MLEANAAGIDVGAREMFVAVPADRDANPVRVFPTFTEDLEGGFPADSVAVVNPDRGFYGPLHIDIRDKRLNIVAASIEDRLKVTPELAYTTLMTTLSRLAEKGILSQARVPDRRAFEYRATGSPPDYLAAASREQTSRMLEQFG